MRRTRVKICGVTRVADAELAIELGADFIGVNLYPDSPRYVEPAAAREIAAAVAGRVRVVGVVVNESAQRVRELEALCAVDLVQFHGDESPEDVAEFAGRAIKALRITSPLTTDSLALWRAAWGILVESRHPRLYGGTGAAWGYEMIGPLARRARLFVAGGLGPGNVRRAVAVTGAWGVDVCSGVESAPGIKDETLLRRFFDEVRRGQE